ncbi:S9 family peptidase [Sphingomonas sp. JC676]|uniref:alpha/beta hydrolase family protein n=1 Tax=Sphingomonas sp. JC676 TaxID=2768065 RepID=UPI00165818BA|nr:S9 family peptidase [Sphingomonas sp. JC676]MBC9033326.1 S9 family peptidase [Sphingomonas sp. JC676]
MKVKLLSVLALASALSLSGPAPAADPDPTVPTAADFGAVPMIKNPKLSPDGSLVAAEGLIKGKSVVLIVQPSGIKPIPVPDKHRIEWIRWAGSRRLLVSLSTITRELEEEQRMTRIVMLDLDTGKQRFVGPREQGVDGDDIVHIDEGGNFVLLSTQPSIYEYPVVYRVDLATGKSSRVVDAREDVWNWYADPSGVVRAGIAIRDDKWWVYYRDGAKGTFARTKRRDFDDNDAHIDTFEPVVGSDKGLAVAAGDSGRFGLYRYDFKNDQLGEKIYENPVVDITDYDVASDGTVRGIFYDDDKPEVTWLDPEMKKLQAKLDRAVPGHLNRIVSSSRDKMRLLVWSGSAEDPGVYYLYDRTTNHMDLFAEPFPGLGGKRLAPMEPVRYKARDGLELRAYLTLPPGRDPAKLPLIVMPHGGPFARDSWGYDPWVQYLASKGYAVLQPNYRGSTGFGRAFVEKGNGQFGRGMQDDVDDGVKWLAERGTVDAKRVCIMGASYGGYAAMLAAERNPEIYRCAISFAGISDVASQLRYDRKSFSATRYFRNWRDRVRGDKSFELDTISPIKQAAQMTVPILIAHGEDDDNVPLYQSRRLHEALMKLKRPHEYVTYPNEGHGFSDPVHATDFLTRVGKFLDAHNPS